LFQRCSKALPICSKVSGAGEVVEKPIADLHTMRRQFAACLLAEFALVVMLSVIRSSGCVFMKWLAKISVLLFSVSALLASAQSASEKSKGVQETQARGFWTDPSTGLMWAGKDNCKDVSWKKAIKYCSNLRLAGYSDWRLANMAELQGIFDLTANSPGQAAPKEPRDFTFHVKGDLFLTGNQWSRNYRMDDRGRPIGYSYYFDFNSGNRIMIKAGTPTASALCVCAFPEDDASQARLWAGM
jgi:hypothetical protein